jgi:hypothetical protein
MLTGGMYVMINQTHLTMDAEFIVRKVNKLLKSQSFIDWQHDSNGLNYDLWDPCDWRDRINTITDEQKTPFIMDIMHKMGDQIFNVVHDVSSCNNKSVNCVCEVEYEDCGMTSYFDIHISDRKFVIHSDGTDEEARILGEICRQLHSDNLLLWLQMPAEKQPYLLVRPAVWGQYINYTTDIMCDLNTISNRMGICASDKHVDTLNQSISCTHNAHGKTVTVMLNHIGVCIISRK